MSSSPRTIAGHASYDAVIVGARCAGAATAMLLARHGLRVLALDRSAFGSDTLSTHALMRGGVLQLARWGLLDAVRATDTPRVLSTTFHYGDKALEVAIKDRDGVEALYAPRRTLLDALLVDAARDHGAEVRHGVRVTGLLRDYEDRVTGVRVDDGTGQPRAIEAAIVIGADGQKSQVARWTNAPIERAGKHGAGVTYAYFADVALAGYHWHFAPGMSAGAIPTGGGLTCVFVGMPPERHARELARTPHAGFARALADAAPALAAALRGARQVGGFHHFAGRPGYLRRPFGPGFALVGDAGAFKDPGIAHGITDALRDAELLARAVVAGGSQTTLAAYAAERDALSWRMLDIADALASFQWDLPVAQALHVALSEEMAREVRAIKAWDTARAAA